MKNLLFSFEDMSPNGKAAKQAVKYFARAGANVISTDVSPSPKRSSGVSYREMTLTMNDSQKVTLRVKQSGDIFQVLLNGSVMPIRSQDDHVTAIGEIAKALDVGRSKFQKKLARALVKLPPSVRTAAPRMESALVEKRDALKEAIADVRAEIEALRAA